MLLININLYYNLYYSYYMYKYTDKYDLQVVLYLVILKSWQLICSILTLIIMIISIIFYISIQLDIPDDLNYELLDNLIEKNLGLGIPDGFYYELFNNLTKENIGLSDEILSYYDESLSYLDDGCLKVWKDDWSRYYPWTNYGTDKNTGTGPGGGGGRWKGPDSWPLDDENYRKDDKYKKLKKSHIDALNEGESPEVLMEKIFGSPEQRFLKDHYTGKKIYLQDIKTLEQVQSNLLYHFLPYEGVKSWSEYGLRMEIHTKGNTFQFADVMYPGKDKCTSRIYNEQTLVKLILKQRDLAGIHFFYNGSGEPQPYVYRMKALYNLSNPKLKKNGGSGIHLTPAIEPHQGTSTEIDFYRDMDLDRSSSGTRDISIANLLNT